jgi:ACS family hexuronate transporter-like MFS transporter
MDAPTMPAPSAKIGRYRWVIVGLLFLAMVINYVDRQTIGLLKADLSKEFGWDETHYADLVFYFQLAYAVAYWPGARSWTRSGPAGASASRS